MKFSIIIPVRSINDHLRENIANLKLLKYEDFEVIILTDNTESYDFGDGRFKLLATGSVGPGEKRNVGANTSTGDILAFLDDDAYPKDDWLNKAYEIFKDKSIYALGAPAITPLNAGFLERCSGRVLESILSSAGTVYRYVPMSRRIINDYPTVNFLVKKEAFLSVGGFIKDFWPGEDTKLCLDLINKFGKEFIYDPALIVYHHRRNLFRPHLKQISRYGQHRGHFARIFPENSRNPSYFVPSLYILGLVAGPLVCLLIPILWFVYLPVVLIYFMLISIEVVRVSIKDKSLKVGLYVAGGIVLTHIVYGVNFIIGLLKKPELKLKKFGGKAGNYVEG
ncbi:hypothetical protein A3F07_00815 [candidate division WWE3 bacterium RIFCSPHIGHO2_12_FULL_38_15]|uniref:Glycosyltransferase 2-like domain-containing protein n=1 Tax=candidate division WWE3 bacterium RIFCSPHIGHO2_02_FULL_38_14 TaxID=1802620 RepID=A0A1F4VB78_UNCKA|nr:MAG: hypothetical protein A2793_00900 [candidate division WWE3 bacterium RIFCSPHIGHO2_01_FULL_38_45]OGC49116.1 MAG: hypothetical protein A3F07_00815 [candidate division WWE3 bacterium RIFCSPHIGHO2_12_FULL_38_15]OGC53571.1 MAG: hypothetical protein A3B64_04450 [candidate division WWE3 bacterium RIFCSPLOWO2_01_FULL_37_24]OGC54475.1 MAG: hypothetical protein A3D91_01080 [candidate division WWE3 bacterium RIFCSPHIGHO2_02_FULL_38_14]HLB51721.1 glycosyltransferase [Patescibacteria group bacterium]